MLKIIQCKKIDSNQINQNLGKLFDSCVLKSPVCIMYQLCTLCSS